MTRRQTASIVFVVLCIVLVAAAVTLNIGWILVNGRRVAPLVLGVITFSLIIAGLIVYTVFRVREMGITEQQDSFLNSVTHELKTPIASIRLYLETLQAREVAMRSARSSTASCCRMRIAYSTPSNRCCARASRGRNADSNIARRSISRGSSRSAWIRRARAITSPKTPSPWSRATCRRRSSSAAVDPTKPKHLVTVRGVGYKFVSES